MIIHCICLFSFPSSRIVTLALFRFYCSWPWYLGKYQNTPLVEWITVWLSHCYLMISDRWAHLVQCLFPEWLCQASLGWDDLPEVWNTWWWWWWWCISPGKVMGRLWEASLDCVSTLFLSSLSLIVWMFACGLWLNQWIPCWWQGGILWMLMCYNQSVSCIHACMCVCICVGQRTIFLESILSFRHYVVSGNQAQIVSTITCWTILLVQY